MKKVLVSISILHTCYDVKKKKSEREREINAGKECLSEKARSSAVRSFRAQGAVLLRS